MPSTYSLLNDYTPGHKALVYSILPEVGSMMDITAITAWRVYFLIMPGQQRPGGRDRIGTKMTMAVTAGFYAYLNRNASV